MRLIGLIFMWSILDYIFSQDLPMILTPINDIGNEVAVLIVPGAYINAIYYQPLGEALQNSTSLRLWVGLVGPFANDFPNPSQCSKNIETTLSLMRGMGMVTNVVFLAGHSLGGVVMQPWGWEHQDQLSGFILMASELTLDNLSNATLPVMHISGDLDGMVTTSETAPIYKELESLVVINADNKWNFPVVIIENVNHMHFASGPPPAAVENGDILSPMPEDTAHQIISVFMLAFINKIAIPGDTPEDATNKLEYAYNNTGYILKPLFEMIALTDGITYSEWSQEAQIIISSIEHGYEDRLNVTDSIVSANELEFSRPALDLVEEDLYVYTFTNVKYPSLLSQEQQTTADQMSVKFKSREAIMELLSPLGIPFGGNASCQLINKSALNKTLTAATPLQVSRYFSRGKLILFEEDDEKVTGQGWVNSETVYISNGTNLLVISSSLHTDTNIDIGDIAGMHYCKLMPPARMMEYVMIDSLRETTPTSDTTVNELSKSIISFANRARNSN